VYIALLPENERKEVLDRIDQYVIPCESDRYSTSFNVSELLEDPLINSAFSETLRLQVNGLSTRGVEKDTSVTVNGQPYVLEKGTTVFCSMPGVHKDPEIFENPEEFRLKRFIHLHTKANGSDIRSTPFTKNGIPLRFPFLPWGGGNYMVASQL